MKIASLILLTGAALGAATLTTDDEAAEARAATRAAAGYTGESTLVLPVDDLEKALTWYQDTLGFELLFQVKDIGFAELATPTKDLAIGLSQQRDATHGDSALTMGVEDMPAARKALEARGVEFAGETETYPGLVELSFFADPWGNNWVLHRSLQR